MASKFRKYAMNDCEQTLYNIYDFIVNSGQTALRLVNDTGAAVALLKFGTGFVSSWASSSDTPDGSYMVIEPVTALSTFRWQAKIMNDAANTTKVQFSTRGGWTNAGAAFGASSKTDLTTFNDGSAPGAGSQIYCGCGTFAVDGSNTGTYAYFNIRDSASASADQMTYFGHYYPWDIAFDTNPTVFLARVPTLVAGSLDFGRNSADANCLNRTSVEVAQTTALSAAGYARIGFYDAPNTPGTTCIWRDLNNYYPPLPVYVFLRNSSMHGHLGDHIRACHGALTDYDTNVAATHMVFGDLYVHYDESL